MKKQNWKIKLGIGLMLACIPFFLIIPVFPFIEIENTTKVWLSTASLVIGEILFWGGGLLVGKELFTKYKSYFNPKNWFKGSNNKDSELERKEEEKEV
ncbi:MULTISPECIES: transporter suffix domain-containing protein [unclassified Lentimicrobium]|uniref:transporter suffix domain-containing protein n=1 Tax=unclassified Lentimicrobium TaxID=2677434 RepID=UPI001551C6E0|nr:MULTISPECIES: transporter suffix domain-containing protein [unclassified Lentimicrobium]NPD45242.1 transporter suffix domain-containing protein [Lentimicrobium sp. S6]NPD85421.1 transporter suffix domain-containing protein [Lentimicrobium sp. L6]